MLTEMEIKKIVEEAAEKALARIDWKALREEVRREIPSVKSMMDPGLLAAAHVFRIQIPED